MTNVRGFATWKPDAGSRDLLEKAQAVLEEYRAHLPLTIRQILYRLVGVHDYSKDGYKRLARVLKRARRARMVPMESIRDDGAIVLAPTTYADAEDFLDVVQHSAEQFQLDRTAGQPKRLVVWCESAGMAPQLQRVAAPYGIKVLSGGGFDSVTVKHAFAKELADVGRPTEVLHIGDSDHHGKLIFKALDEDVVAFAEDLGGSVSFFRLAVTAAQIRQYRLPVVQTDQGPACQAEALAPDVLARILDDAIRARLNNRAYNRVLRAEKAVRRALRTRLGVT